MNWSERLGINLNTVEGLKEAMRICPSRIDSKTRCYSDGHCKDCSDCRAEFLMSKAPTKMVKRVELYEGDFEKASAEFEEVVCRAVSGCTFCVYNSCTTSQAGCFVKWLSEEIEVAV